MSVAFDRGYQCGLSGGEAADCPYAGKTLASGRLRSQWFDGFDDGWIKKCERDARGNKRINHPAYVPTPRGKYHGPYKRGEYFKMRLAQIKASHSA